MATRQRCSCLRWPRDEETKKNSSPVWFGLTIPRLNIIHPPFYHFNLIVIGPHTGTLMGFIYSSALNNELKWTKTSHWFWYMNELKRTIHIQKTKGLDHLLDNLTVEACTTSNHISAALVSLQMTPNIFSHGVWLFSFVSDLLLSYFIVYSERFWKCSLVILW